MKRKNCARLYRDVPPEQYARLLRFRATHSPRSLQAAGLSWQYLASGYGARHLLVLPGGLRMAEAAFPLISALEADFRVLAPSYPPARRLDALLDGLAAILDAEGAAQAAVYGASYGGMIAQSFRCRYPTRVSHLLLANTGLPPTRDEVRTLPSLITLLRLLPYGALRRLITPLFGRLITAGAEQPFWQAFIEELLTCRLRKADVLSHFQVALDLGRRYRFSPDDVAHWPGRVLILESVPDVIQPAEQAALRTLYPGAQVHTFPQGGPTPWLTRTEEYVGVIRAFLVQ